MLTVTDSVFAVCQPGNARSQWSDRDGGGFRSHGRGRMKPHRVRWHGMQSVAPITVPGS